MATNKNPGFTFRESKAIPFTSISMLPDVEVIFTLYSMSRSDAINSVLKKFYFLLKFLCLDSMTVRPLDLFPHNTRASQTSPISKWRHGKSFLLRSEPGLLLLNFSSARLSSLLSMHESILHPWRNDWILQVHCTASPPPHAYLL